MRVVDQHLERCLAQSPESRNVGAQLPDDRPGALQVELGQAEQVHREGDMAELGEPGRPLPGMPAKAAAFVDDEDARRRLTHGAVGQEAGKGPAVRLIVDRLQIHGRLLHRRRSQPCRSREGGSIAPRNYGPMPDVGLPGAS
jgi:hypothetical protein